MARIATGAILVHKGLEIAIQAETNQWMTLETPNHTYEVFYNYSHYWVKVVHDEEPLCSISDSHLIAIRNSMVDCFDAILNYEKEEATING